MERTCFLQHRRRLASSGPPISSTWSVLVRKPGQPVGISHSSCASCRRSGSMVSESHIYVDLALLLCRLLFLFLWREGFDLQCMYSAFSCEFLLQQLVHHAVSLNLSAALKLVGDDHQAEVCLGRCAAGHRFVVLVEVGVIVDFDVVAKLFDELQQKVASAEVLRLWSPRWRAYLRPDDLLDGAASLGARGRATRLRHGREQASVQECRARGRTQGAQRLTQQH